MGRKDGSLTCTVDAPLVLLPPTHVSVVDYTVVNDTAQLKAAWSAPIANADLFDYYVVAVTEGPIDNDTNTVLETIIVSFIVLCNCLVLRNPLKLILQVINFNYIITEFIIPDSEQLFIQVCPF